MTYIGLSPPNTFTKSTSQTFTGNGSTTAFTLQTRVASPEDLEVFVSNVQQQPTESYTIGSDGVTMTFSEAPPSGTFYVIYRTVAQQSGTDTGASRLGGNNTFTGNQSITGNLTIDGTSTLTGGDDGDILLVFNTDRTWQFQQSGDDAQTRLQLKANSPSKTFDIVNSAGSSNFSFETSATAPVFQLRSNASLQFEGATINNFETTLTVTDPTADRTITLPDASGTVLLNSGNQTISSGNLVIGTSGKGIDFSATSGSASGSTSALLDDYEEGTFTAQFTNFSGSATFSNAVYVKIGQMVFFTLHITGKSNTSDGDQMTVSGFPFAVLGEHPASVGMNDNEFGHAMINTAEYLYFYNLTGGPFTYDMFPHTSGYARIQGAYRIA